MIAIRIPPELHKAIPDTHSVSGMVRQMLASAVENPEAVVSAFATVGQISTTRSPDRRYAIYMTDEENAKASLVAERYLISLNQLVQILLEDLLCRAGRWPVRPHSTA